jgi:hypothetical protein
MNSPNDYWRVAAAPVVLGAARSCEERGGDQEIQYQDSTVQTLPTRYWEVYSQILHTLQGNIIAFSSSINQLACARQPFFGRFSG